MAKTKSKKTSATTEPKVTEARSEKVVTIKTIEKPDFKKCIKQFFAKKYDEKENILTIFKSPRVWGALLGELLGTMILTMFMLTLGIYQPLYLMFGMIFITMAVYALSGSQLNPLITASMMATRRMSAIRGVLYILTQIVGAWLGFLIVNAFRLGANTEVSMPTLATITEKTLLTCLMVELFGAIIIGFFYNRAQDYKTRHGVFTYSAIVAGGVILAVLLGIVISSNFYNLKDTFVMNPAIAIMQQIFPSTADNFNALVGQVTNASLVYILIPMIGGIIGAYLSEISTKLADEIKE